MSRGDEAPRRRSRDIALQVLYAMDLDPEEGSFAPARAQEHFERVAANFELPKGARKFGEELVQGVSTHILELDASIERNATNWRVERMTVIDRNLLRLAAFELLHTDTPVPIVIDEAVEMAQRFGTDPSPGFVNGILDSLARQCENRVT